MKFGLFYLPTYLQAERDAHTHLKNITEQVLFAEQIGMEYVWMVEHHFVRHGGLCASNFSLLSYLAAKTSKIRLGTGATVLPLNDPVRVAEMGATLDQISDGRFDFGVGRGFLRDEFDAFGVEMRESRERVEEGVELIKRAWTQPALDYSGKFRPPVSGMPILPPPYQKPHPPIWVACFLSPESFEWTAKEGYDLLYVAYHVDPPLAKERIGWYLNALPKYGRKAEDHEVCCCYHAFFQEKDDPAALQATVGKAMAEYSDAGAEAARRPPDPATYKGYAAREDYHTQAGFEVYFPNRVLMGGPERVLDRLRQMRDAGITQVSLIADFGSLPQKEIMRSLEIFARDVLPAAREI
ncbi:MAG: LLM class flavin-dependent oxidoreductase [Rhodospirillaceae bacterium]|nr:LLM class flavin-dependent oxidoreductase [Rhodospirillaceae bacterium]